MRKFYFVSLLIILSQLSVAQQSGIPIDSIAQMPVDSSESTKRWDIAVDLTSRYIWRGQSWGGNYQVAQPSFNYAVSNKLSVGIWATTNFQQDYYENDGVTQKGYHEFDLGLTYKLNNFLTLQIWDYYWPALQRMDGVDTDYFNYGPNGVKTIDASAVFDFSDGYQFAFDGIISTIIGGNDYRYIADGTDYSRNYTTYVELGYQFPDIFALFPAKCLQNIDAHPAIGAVLNNEAEYYTYGNYDRPSFVNLALNLTREFQIGESITLPITITYTHNAATANTEIYGKNFLIAGISFWY